MGVGFVVLVDKTHDLFFGRGPLRSSPLSEAELRVMKKWDD